MRRLLFPAGPSRDDFVYRCGYGDQRPHHVAAQFEKLPVCNEVSIVRYIDADAEGRHATEEQDCFKRLEGAPVFRLLVRVWRSHEKYLGTMGGSSGYWLSHCL